MQITVFDTEKVGIEVLDWRCCKFQATKNPSTLNQNGGVDGLHKMGDIKEKQWH